MSATVSLDLLNSLMDDIADTLQNEANQSILQRSPDKGFAALGGLDALYRLRQRLQVQGVLFNERRNNSAKVSVLRGMRG